MFGFKSKKDKRIEYLENRIRELEMTFYPPKVFQQDYQIETITAMKVVEPGIPIDVVKTSIAAIMLEDLKMRGIHFEPLHGDRGDSILRGTLHYVPILQFSRK